MIRAPKIFAQRELPTPFGRVTLPNVEVPKWGLPRVDERRKSAVKHAVATDLSGALGLIPYVGSLIGGQIADLHFAEMKEILTPQEMDEYVESDKRIPSNGLALLYSFVEGRKSWRM